MVTRSIRFDDTVYDVVMAEAEKRKVSFNWLVNKLLEEALLRLSEPGEFKVTQ